MNLVNFKLDITRSSSPEGSCGLRSRSVPVSEFTEFTKFTSWLRIPYLFEETIYFCLFRRCDYVAFAVPFCLKAQFSPYNMTDPVRGDLAFIVFAVLFREGDAMSLPDSCAGSRLAITMIHRRD